MTLDLKIYRNTIFIIMNKSITTILLFFCFTLSVFADDGYRLWLRFDLIEDLDIRNEYQEKISSIVVMENSPTSSIIAKELQEGLSGLIGQPIHNTKEITSGSLIVTTSENKALIKTLQLNVDFDALGPEGYQIMDRTVRGSKVFVIVAKTDIGALYGSYHFLRLIQTQRDITIVDIKSVPKTQRRLLNHWDNLDRTIERGYAGFSIWDWHRLPDYIDPRYIEYARANASIGINGVSLTNVNANALLLTPLYLEKVKVLADLFRPYGIKVYLTARFSAPSESGSLETSDPLDSSVQEWWNQKAVEIYNYIPDFGGFLVKANSEGQPGPQDYNRSHADGANMLADALAPHGGIVMWRAFVYSHEEPTDRAKQAFDEFTPLDGTFRDNVMVQVKNGPIDFQPREPFHPLFGAMPRTPLMMEFQITQEYLGQATNMVFLADLYKEVLDSDTYVHGKGSTVASFIDGTSSNYSLTGMAGVSNIGNDRNWTGHLFGQANWYAFGRLAWDHTITSSAIADEWLRMTFTNDTHFVEPIKNLMLNTHETVVNYSTPLGLHHMMAAGHHYGPGPWVDNMSRADWTSVYYHKADSIGLGFDRTDTGSAATAQYAPLLKEIYDSPALIPTKYLMWFHHVAWDYLMPSGRTMWEDLCYSYETGIKGVADMRDTWASIEGLIDQERFEHVSQLLVIQEKEAHWWRNSCLHYFQSFSHRALPAGMSPLENDLEYYKKLDHPYSPGIRPKW